jgi:hypothetical protein
VNTIDAGIPVSSVAALPATNPPSFAVSWTGADDAGGSGIASFDIFVSVDGGPFTLWLDDTPDFTAQFSGAPDHTYAFYSVATDNVSHMEAAPSVADSSTVTVPLEPGDYNRNGIVETGDYQLWRAAFGNAGANLVADGNGDGFVDAADYVVWRKNSWTIVHDPLGDYNADGLISIADYNSWRAVYGQTGQNLPADGNQDGTVDAADYVIWRSRNRSIVVALPLDPGEAKITDAANSTQHHSKTHTINSHDAMDDAPAGFATNLNHAAPLRSALAPGKLAQTNAARSQPELITIGQNGNDSLHLLSEEKELGFRPRYSRVERDQSPDAVALIAFIESLGFDLSLKSMMLVNGSERYGIHDQVLDELPIHEDLDVAFADLSMPNELNELCQQMLP